jgi:hypothetical protein
LLTSIKYFDILFSTGEFNPMRKALEHCPTCGGELEITRLNCTQCDTVILSRYEMCRFCRLPAESLEFLETFVRNRGNVKEMERELGISYWTIRSRLNDLIEELGFEAKKDPDEVDVETRQREILERLKAGELSASEAAHLLAKLR